MLADPRYRALSARLLSAGPSHPALLEAYWHHHVLPRSQHAHALLRRAQTNGVLAPTADTDILLDMMAGAVIHHLLLEPGQPNPRRSPTTCADCSSKQASPCPPTNPTVQAAAMSFQLPSPTKNGP